MADKLWAGCANARRPASFICDARLSPAGRGDGRPRCRNHSLSQTSQVGALQADHGSSDARFRAADAQPATRHGANPRVGRPASQGHGARRRLRWEAQTYNSLSEIAKAITGTKWNGPRFFGLRDKRHAEVTP